jgi:hypothetical protein
MTTTHEADPKETAHVEHIKDMLTSGKSGLLTEGNLHEMEAWTGEVDPKDLYGGRINRPPDVVHAGGHYPQATTGDRHGNRRINRRVVTGSNVNEHRARGRCSAPFDLGGRRVVKEGPGTARELMSLAQDQMAVQCLSLSKSKGNLDTRMVS